MGELQHKPFQFAFNGFLKVAFQGSRVTSDAARSMVVANRWHRRPAPAADTEEQAQADHHGPEPRAQQQGAQPSGRRRRIGFDGTQRVACDGAQALAELPQLARGCLSARRASCALRRKPGTTASCTSLWMSKPVTWSPASSRASGLETLPGWRHSSARSSVPSPRPRPTPRTTPATSIRRWRITVLIDRRRC